MQRKYLGINRPVLTSSVAPGYGPYAAHVDKTVDWWCAADANGPHHISFRFIAWTIIHEVKVSTGNIVSDTVTSTPINFDIFYNANPASYVKQVDLDLNSWKTNITVSILHKLFNKNKFPLK